MPNPKLFTLMFLLSAAAFPVAVSAQQPAVSAQQPDMKPGGNQVQNTPGQTTPVQPERTPQQSDQARQQDKSSAENERINRDWTARERGDERADIDRMRQRRMDRADQDQDDRTVGRNWRRYDEEGRGYEMRPRRRVKTCFEYPNGDEFCRYMD